MKQYIVFTWKDCLTGAIKSAVKIYDTSFTDYGMINDLWKELQNTNADFNSIKIVQRELIK